MKIATTSIAIPLACAFLVASAPHARGGARGFTSEDFVLVRPSLGRTLRNSFSALRSSATADPETVWIGHVTGPTGLPGAPGGYGPYHVGRGTNHIVGGSLGSGSAYDGVWDFDHFQPGEMDSLMGWWPVPNRYRITGSSNLDDWKRPWFGLDYGNNGNYVIPQGSPKRTFGVTGYWHADGGSSMPARPSDSADHNPITPSWQPISGTKSAWCGLRSHGDVSVLDPITGNPYCSSILDLPGTSNQAGGSSSLTGTDRNFPGYGSQWDQMLYRDVVLPQGAGFQLSFDYTTSLSTQFSILHWSQTGWFDKDPLKPVTANGDGNFISTCNECGAPGVVDSFMVYIGAPAEPLANTPPLFLPNDFLGTDGAMHEIFDPQRRWFSEVVKIDAPGSTYREILSVAGARGTTSSPIHFIQSFTPTVVNAILDADGVSGDGGTLRVVFRVKTNRGSDDENYGDGAFSSGTAGAAILDNVSFGGVVVGDFEGPDGGIDNRPSIPATAAWKATGKPPGAYFHIHDVNDLPYEDPCGPLAAPVRFCNMGNAVLSPGDHDLADKPGGIFGDNTQERVKYAASPTINLCSNGPGDYNAMGIDAEIASRSPVLYGDVMWNLYQIAQTGGSFGIGWQSYPVRQANGVKCWSATRTPWALVTGGGGCFAGLWSDAAAEGSIVTSNVSGVPDSIRVYIQSHTRCYLLGLTSINCSPASGAYAGGYFDDLSIGFAPHQSQAFTQSLAKLSFNDCFPVNAQNKSVGSFGLAYDTLAARIQGSQNETDAGSNELTGPDARENIAGDSSGLAAPGQGIRVDLVFRISPGVGNYVQVGNRSSGVARRPDTVPRILASPGDLTNASLGPVDRFWGAYMADNGAFGTGGNGTSGPGHPGAWDPNRWNSARMDTVEWNFFPLESIQPNLSFLSPGFYMTCYHENDPKYDVLGIAKNRCFLNKNKQPVKLNQDQINCGLAPVFTTYPPSFYATGGAPVPGTGLAASEDGLPIGRTYEFTKILPDGQFTPGTEIQYFARRSRLGDPATVFALLPDTDYVSQQGFDWSDTNFRRWSSVHVLPDRWKDLAFGGTGMACMLVVDFGTGDLSAWVAVADSIGLTAIDKRGAHNGWRARPDQSILGSVGKDDSICRRDNGGQPGSLWDLYTVGGDAGGLGSRLAAKNDTPGSFTMGRWSTHGPSEDMLRNYRMVVLLSSGGATIGPVSHHTDDDVALLQSFLNLSGGSSQPRGLIAIGAGLAASLDIEQPSFLHGTFLTGLRDDNYRALSGNTNDIADLIVQPVISTGLGSGLGFWNRCDQKVSVLDWPAPGGQPAAYYEAAGASPPYVAGVYGPPNGSSRMYSTLINGWGLGGGGFGAKCPGCVDAGGRPLLLSVGIRRYLFDMLTNAFAGLQCSPLGPPVGVGDQPGRPVGIRWLATRSGNPSRSGETRISFRLGATEKVQLRVYDAAGRLVRTVANRVFAASVEHVVVWDGTDDGGRPVHGGVYFYQLRTPSWTGRKKLVLLGR